MAIIVSLGLQVFSNILVHIKLMEALFYTIVLILALISIILAVIFREAPTI
jgi:hypothetical protein